MGRKHIELILLTFLFIVAFYFWTLPFQSNPIPYGDVDSSTHFALADYMGQHDAALYYLPYYIAAGGYIDEGAGRLWYPPQFHLTAAMSQILASHRTFGILLFHAIANFAIVFTSYLLIRHLYGMSAAFLSSFLLIFSIRDIIWYVAGQYPQVLAFALVPVTLYCYYRYITDNAKKLYIYLAAIVLGIQFYMHPQSILASALIAGIFTLLYFSKTRKIPFKIQDFAIFIAIAAIMIIPVYSFPFSSQSGYTGAVSSGAGIHPEYFHTLKYWYGLRDEQGNIKPVGINIEYYYFSAMHAGYWILVLSMIGIGFMLLRRNTADLLMLSWIIAFYILSHDFVFGLFRAERFVETEAHFLYPIAALGLLGIPSVVKLNDDLKRYVKYGLMALFLILAITMNAKAAYTWLNGAYPGINRLTPPQYEVSEWLYKNTPEQSDILIKGTVIYTKKKWIQAMSQRHIDWVRQDIAEMHDYVLLDYSDLYFLSQNPQYQQAMQAQGVALQDWEQKSLANSTIVYNNQGIVKVYKLG